MVWPPEMRRKVENYRRQLRPKHAMWSRGSNERIRESSKALYKGDEEGTEDCHEEKKYLLQELAPNKSSIELGMPLSCKGQA